MLFRFNFMLIILIIYWMSERQISNPSAGEYDTYNTKTQVLPKITRRPKLNRNTDSIRTRVKSCQDAPKVKAYRRTQALQTEAKASFVQKYCPVSEQRKYELLKDSQIGEQNDRLVKTLHQISQEVTNIFTHLESNIQTRINRISFKGKNPPLLESPERKKQLIQMQIKNNEDCLKMFKVEYTSLKRREKQFIGGSLRDRNSTSDVYVIQDTLKSELQISIKQTEQILNSIKRQNYEIKQKNKTLGDSINKTDDFLLKMRQIEDEVQYEQKNMQRLQQKLSKSQRMLTQSYRKLFELKQKSQTAEEYFQKQSQLQKKQQTMLQKYSQLGRKKQELDLISKKYQTNIQMSQMKYHDLLKKLEQQTGKTKELDIHISGVQLNNRDVRAQVIRLEQWVRKRKAQIARKKAEMSELISLSNQLLAQSSPEKEHSFQDIEPVNRKAYEKNPKQEQPQEKGIKGSFVLEESQRKIKNEAAQQVGVGMQDTMSPQ